MGTKLNRITPLLMGLVFIATGVVLSYFGYVWGHVPLNPSELLGSVLFWCAIVYLLLTFPFREVTRSFALYLRKTFGAGVFVSYLAIHLILYGFLLETILISVYGIGGFAVSPGFLLSTNAFSPPSLSNAILDVAYNPSIVVTVSPVFSAVLSLYSVSMALVISILVVVSIGMTKEIGELCTIGKKARSFVVLPALGVVFGASCCLSVAGLISLAVPAASLLTSVIWIYYVTYFIFPFVAVVLLYLNLLSIEKISAGLRSSIARNDTIYDTPLVSER